MDIIELNRDEKTQALDKFVNGKRSYRNKKKFLLEEMEKECSELRNGS